MTDFPIGARVMSYHDEGFDVGTVTNALGDTIEVVWRSGTRSLIAARFVEPYDADEARRRERLLDEYRD